MDYEELKTRLVGHLTQEIDLDQHYKSYREKIPDGPLDHYLMTLHMEQLISDKLYNELQEEVESEITLAWPEDLNTIAPNTQSTEKPKPNILPFSRGSKSKTEYHIIDKLGKGSMGEVLLAEHEALRRKVAYKQLPYNGKLSNSVLTRFLSEAQITAQLEHPNIVPIYGIELLDDKFGYAMKWVHGKELNKYLEEAKDFYKENRPIKTEWDLPSRLEYFLKVCDALEYAHSKGVIHRDLKPANIMIGKHRQVYVMDWGIARLIGGQEIQLDQSFEGFVSDERTIEDGDKTQFGTVMGTPRYLSPEQALGDTQILDQRSDLYSLGIILQEVVTLQRATPSTNGQIHKMIDNATKGIKEPIIPYSTKINISPALRAIIQKATEIERGLRYASVQEMSNDLRQYLNDGPVSAYDEGMVEKLRRWTIKNPSAFFGSMMLFILIVVGVYIGLLQKTSIKLKQTRKDEQNIQGLLTAISDSVHQMDLQMQYFDSLIHQTSGSVGLVFTQAEFQSYIKQNTRPLPDISKSNTATEDELRSITVVEEKDSVVKFGLITWDHLSQIFKQILLKGERHLPTTFTTLSKHQDQINDYIVNYGTTIYRIHLFWQPSKDKDSASKFAMQFSYPADNDYRNNYQLYRNLYMKFSNKDPEVKWGMAYYDSAHNKWLLPLSQSLHNPNTGEYLGHLGMDIDLYELTENSTHLEGLEVYFVHNSGQVIFNGENAQTNQPSIFPFPDILNKLKQGKMGYVERVYKGENNVVAFFPIYTPNIYYIVNAKKKMSIDRGEMNQIYTTAQAKFDSINSEQIFDLLYTNLVPLVKHLYGNKNKTDDLQAILPYEKNKMAIPYDIAMVIWQFNETLTPPLKLEKLEKPSNIKTTLLELDEYIQKFVIHISSNRPPDLELTIEDKKHYQEWKKSRQNGPILIGDSYELINLLMRTLSKLESSNS